MLHILIAVIESEQCTKLSRLVEEMGYTVIGKATCQSEAMAVMEQGWPTVLLVDMHLGFGGNLLCSVHQQRVPVIPILLGECAGFDQAHHAMEKGAIGFLRKPIVVEELRQALQRAECRVLYLHAVHREFTVAQHFFEELEFLRPHELIQKHADILERFQSFEEVQPGERLGLLRIFYAKWHDVMRRRGVAYQVSFINMNEEEMVDRLQKLTEFWCAQVALSVSGKVKLNIRMACDFIQGHYKECYTLAEISERFGMSPSYFSAQLKQYTGYSFINYTNRIRIRNAKKLLLQPELKVYEVAEATGFDTLQYFNRVFKQLVQMTPGDYRRRSGI